MSGRQTPTGDAVPTDAVQLRTVLRDGTRPLHDELEAVPLMRSFACGDLDSAALRRYLLLQFAIHDALEPGLAAFLPDGFASQRKAQWLASDYRETFGCSPERCDVQVPDITSEFIALGVAYVLEGSTLGLQMIRKRRLAAGEQGWLATSRFVRGYGEETGRHWKQLLVLLDAVPELHWQEAAGAARATFAAYLEAFSGAEAPPPTASANRSQGTAFHGQR